MMTCSRESGYESQKEVEGQRGGLKICRFGVRILQRGGITDISSF